MEKKGVERKQVLDVIAMIFLVGLCASWGIQQVSIKFANQGVSPILQSGIRSFFAMFLIWIWMAARRQRIFEKDGTLWWGIAAGLLFTGEFLLIYWGLDYTYASRSVIFLYLSPFVVAIGSQLFIPGERLRKIQGLGLCSAFVGILATFGESLTLPTNRVLIGDAMLVVAAVLWGATTVLIKASPLARIVPAKTLLYQLSISGILLPIGSLALGEPGIIKITPLIGLCLVYQVVWVAFITYLIWFWLIRNYPVSRMTSFTFLTPLFGVIAGGVLLHEPITYSLVFALVLVAIGIFLVNRPAPN